MIDRVKFCLLMPSLIGLIRWKQFLKYRQLPIELLNLGSIIITLSLVALFGIQTTISVNSDAEATIMGEADKNNSVTDENTTTPLTTSSTPALSSGPSHSSITDINAQNTHEAIYNCATGDKGVIISPGNFKFTAEKKGNKWTGTLLIKGSTGEKSGHISSESQKGISYSFKGNLNTKNTLCHFPGLQMGGTTFEIGSFTCGTVKNVKYTELSTGNSNTFKARINCK